ncbi:FAD-dependent oxidoreductase [Arsenicicoccus bolidensis]|uniref:FAD-dependent oxidoreductase n=1 Tax=Arsenicicoccus bolidensis TaxID=229480 RepID=UPI0004922BB2|nr:FAD-dependent oxidoreductase [Arsenicicoccus bolidensis]
MTNAHRVRRVAVVGAGPAGLFAAQALAGQDELPVHVDLLDRMPTPFGLLRYGVAPDHESIRSVATALARTLDLEAVTFWGLVEVGRDVSRAELLEAYDAVIYAVGASEDVRLGIPGEDLSGSRSAREFVAWYGGHPDARPQPLDGVRAVATVGVGNVAVDLARILLKEARSLRVTDMAEPVLEELARSEVRDVWIVGRRGPQHASYTTKELRELVATPGIDVTVSEGAFDGLDEAALDRRTRANVQLLRGLPIEGDGAPASDGGRRRLHFAFYARPVEMTERDGRVDGLTVERTRLLPDGSVEGTGSLETLDVQLVLRAVGYRGSPLADVPFDRTRAIIPNVEGRVVDEAGVRQPREYCTGWVKRGPIGVIGTNKSDAAQTVAHVLADLQAAEDAPRDPQGGRVEEPGAVADPGTGEGHRPGASRDGVGPVLCARGHHPSTLADWRAIDAAEIELGRGEGRERVKVSTWEELLRLVTDH